jgi:hypothetical protein
MLQIIHNKQYTKSRLTDFHSLNGIKTGDSGIKRGEKGGKMIRKWTKIKSFDGSLALPF